jgi:hypothetical protein
VLASKYISLKLFTTKSSISQTLHHHTNKAKPDFSYSNRFKICNALCDIYIFKFFCQKNTYFCTTVIVALDDFNLFTKGWKKYSQAKYKKITQATVNFLLFSIFMF